MIRLFQIEFFKLKNSKYFWVLTGLFAFFLLSVPLAARAVLVKMTEMGADIKGIGMDDLPLFDFVDIWQNLTWFYSIFSIFLAFIIIISVCNEYRYGTIKQNVMDGLSRKEFLLSKIVFIVAVSVFVTLLVGLIGLLMGFMYSPVTSAQFVFKNIHFLGVYFLELVAYQMLALLASLIIKRSGITIVIMLFYTFLVEPIIRAIIQYKFEQGWLAELLPVKAIGNAIQMPFAKYAFMPSQNFVDPMDLLILLAYLALFTWISFRFISRKDLA